MSGQETSTERESGDMTKFYFTVIYTFLIFWDWRRSSKI